MLLQNMFSNIYISQIVIKIREKTYLPGNTNHNGGLAHQPNGLGS